MLDLSLVNGFVVDGTGSPKVRADIGIRDGRIVAVGRLDEPSRRVIDVDGRIVAPGFIDVHTHLDAQLLWDPYASPSPMHGITTVIGGNCGFTPAPLSDESAPYLMAMLSRVEGIPLAALKQGPSWDWRSTTDYLSRLEGGLGVNAGLLTGHSSLRRTVMGPAANEQIATEEQLRAMATLLDQCLAAGSLGFSSSWSRTHNDAEGDMIPSRYASEDELVFLCGVVGRRPGTSLEFTPPLGPFDEQQPSLMARMSSAANRHLNWGALTVNATNQDACENMLAASNYARERGGKVVAQILAMGLEFWLNFNTGFLFDSIKEWVPAMALPPTEKRALLADPAERAKLREWAVPYGARPGPLQSVFDWPRFEIAETASAATERYRGRLVADIAAAEGKDPFDALLDIVIADDLLTVVHPAPQGFDDDDWKVRAERLRDERTVIAASDAGAHLDFLAQFNFPTVMLDNLVRRRGLLSVEEAVHLMTDRPARLFGLTGRGRLQPGWQADVVVFDVESTTSGPICTRRDLPGDAARIYAEAEGIETVLVNGEPIVERGQFTGALPGRLLRSGRDTETAPARA